MPSLLAILGFLREAYAGLSPRGGLQSLNAEAWSRGGTQEGLGPVTRRDIPEHMRQHDQAHIAEIRIWREKKGQGPTSALP